MSPQLLAVCVRLSMLSAVAAAAAAGGRTDDFSGPLRADVWEARHADTPNGITTEDGWLRFTVGVDHFLFPWDRTAPNPPMALLEPPSRDDAFTLETRVRVVGDGGGARGSLAGLAMFRKDRMALWVWGVTDLGDAGEVTLREYDLERIGSSLWVDVEAPGDLAAGVWLQIAKDGDEYAFRCKFEDDGEWIERTEWPHGRRNFPERYSSGNYLVGLIGAGGRHPYEVEFDYFHSPELGVLDVDAVGKRPLAWAEPRAATR